MNSVMGVTVAHKAPERVANGTCTQVWAWMINKCRRRMNQGEGYITSEIFQKNGEKKEKRKRKKKRGKLLEGSS